MEDLAIVGIFYDGYRDLWRDFFGLLKMNWPNCPYKIYIVDNEIQLSKEDTQGLNVTCYQAGKNAEYSRKVQLALEKVREKYLLLLLEDFYMVSPISSEKIANIMDTIYKNNIDYYTMPMPEFAGKKEKQQYKDTSLKKISVSRNYIFSCQPSIWRRELLKLCIGTDNFNAWVFEGIFAKSECVRKVEFLEDKVIDYCNPLNLRHGAVQGKMLPKTVRLIEKNGYSMTTERRKLNLFKDPDYYVKKAVHRVIGLLKLEKAKIFQKKSIFERFSDDIIMISANTINEQKVWHYIEQHRKEEYKQ